MYRTNQSEIQNLVHSIQRMEVMDHVASAPVAQAPYRSRRRPALVPSTNFGQISGRSWVSGFNIQIRDTAPAPRRRRMDVSFSDVQSLYHTERCGGVNSMQSHSTALATNKPTCFFEGTSPPAQPQIGYVPPATASNPVHIDGDVAAAGPHNEGTPAPLEPTRVPTIRHRNHSPQPSDVLKYVVQLIRDDRDRKVEALLNNNVAHDGSRETQDKVLNVAKFANACKTEVMTAFAVAHGQKRCPSLTDSTENVTSKFFKDSAGTRLAQSEDTKIDD